MTKRIRTSAGSILLALALAFGCANAQTTQSAGNTAHAKSAVAASAPPVVGSGIPGRITRWLGSNGTSFVLGDSMITEDKFGQIGIGTSSPTSKLTVQGMIETKLGGVKFPDGSVQTTAGLSAIFHDATLTGNGTALSPLGIALGQVVKSINGLTDNVTFAAGSNITITPVGNTLTIAASGGQSPAASAFQGQIQGSWADGDGLTQGTLSIPAGKRLVVEFISVTVSLVSGQNVVDVFLTSTLDGNDIPFRIAVNSNPSFPTSPFTHAIDKQVRIYADGLSVSIARSPASGSASFKVLVSGYLVDLP